MVDLRVKLENGICDLDHVEQGILWLHGKRRKRDKEVVAIARIYRGTNVRNGDKRYGLGCNSEMSVLRRGQAEAGSSSG